MKVLVTGGTGFIGRYTIERLLEVGHTPILFDHRVRELNQYPIECEVFFGDIRDEVSMTEAMAHADGFIHLAGVLGTQETITNPRPAALTNIIGGLNVLEAANQYGLPGTYIGVGNHWMNNTYSISKTTVERFVHMFNKERNGKVNIVRVVNAYGPRQMAAAPYGPSKVRKITPAFVCRAIKNDPIEIYGDGEQISDMVYVTDVAKGLVMAMEAAAKNQVFDRAVEIGPRRHNTVKQIAELIVELAGSKSKIKYLPMRPGEVPGDKVTADVKTLQLIGMQTKDFVPLKKGMQNTIDYFRGIL